MKEKIEQFKNYYQTIVGQKAIVNKQFQLNHNEYGRDSFLNHCGVISSEELETSRNQFLQAFFSLENIHSTLQNTEIQITQMQDSFLDTKYQYQDRKNQLETQLKIYIVQLFPEIQIWKLNYILIIAVDSQVTFTNYCVEKQNVTEDETVLAFIPDHDEQINCKAQMPLTLWGKVKKRTESKHPVVKLYRRQIRLVREQSQKYVNGSVKDDKRADYYTVEIELPDGFKTYCRKELPCLPGMDAQVDIVIKDISLYERFFMPIRKIWTDSMIN